MWERPDFLEYDITWPFQHEFDGKPQCILDVVQELLTQEWVNVEMKKPDKSQIVGRVNGKPVRRQVKIFRKTP
jgi:hypothetical protein